MGRQMISTLKKKRKNRIPNNKGNRIRKQISKITPPPHPQVISLLLRPFLCVSFSCLRHECVHAPRRTNSSPLFPWNSEFLAFLTNAFFLDANWYIFNPAWTPLFLRLTSSSRSKETFSLRLLSLNLWTHVCLLKHPVKLLKAPRGIPESFSQPPSISQSSLFLLQD